MIEKHANVAQVASDSSELVHRVGRAVTGEVHCAQHLQSHYDPEIRNQLKIEFSIPSSHTMDTRYVVLR